MSDDDPREIDALLADDTNVEPAAIDGCTWVDRGLLDTVTGILNGTLVMPQPKICNIDGTSLGLFYEGKVHDVHGESGGGKSFLMSYAAAQEIDGKQHVIWVDLEDNEVTLVRRLLDLGCKPEDVVTYLHYKRPSETSFYGMSFLHETCQEFAPTLVVIDSTGESMGMDGVQANEDAEVAKWMRRVARSTADLGPAVVLIDHVPKSSADALMSIGSQRKSAGMDGAIYSVQNVISFSQTKTGYVRIVCGKDRNGTYAKGLTVAEFHFDAGTQRFDLRGHMVAPSAADGGHRPTHIMEEVSRWLEGNPDSSTKNITDAVARSRKDVIRAVEVLVLEDFVARAPRPGRGGGMAHTSKKPFRENPLSIDVQGLLGDPDDD